MDARKRSWLAYVVPASWLEGRTVRLEWYRTLIGIIYGAWAISAIVKAHSGAETVGLALGAFVGFVLFAYGLPRFFRWLEQA
jgi:hypothetical protein